MPGMGLTAVGLAGVVLSYADIAHTFIDGMHALTGLTMIIGLIILAVGILDGGVSTSNRAKATALVVVSIVLSFGTAGFLFNTVSTTGVFAGIMLGIAFPSVMMGYIATKMPQYTKPIGAIFAMAAATGIIMYVAFGMVGPDTYLIPEAVVVEEPEPEPEPFAGTVVNAIMLLGSDVSGNPDYEPDVLSVPQGYGIEWLNEDLVAHTVTSFEDAGAAFDSGLVNPGDVYFLDTGTLEVGEYPYFCLVHPWMQSDLNVEMAELPVAEDPDESPVSDEPLP